VVGCVGWCINFALESELVLFSLISACRFFVGLMFDGCFWSSYYGRRVWGVYCGVCLVCWCLCVGLFVSLLLGVLCGFWCRVLGVGLHYGRSGYHKPKIIGRTDVLTISQIWIN